MAGAVPRGRRRPLRRPRAFWPMLAVAVAAARADRTRAACAADRRAALPAVLIAALPRSRRRSGRTRCACAVAARPGAARARRRAPPRRGSRSPASLVALLYLQWLPAVRAVGRGRRRPVDPGRRSSPSRARSSESGVQPGERVEVAVHAQPLGGGAPRHRGAARARLGAPARPRRPTRSSTTAARSHRSATTRWLRDSAVRWVALPTAPLDYSAEAEAKLLADGLPYLRLAHRTSDWEIWELRDAAPPASGGARVTAAAAERLRDRRRRADRRPPALHAAAGGRTRLRERGAGRLDARRRRAQRRGVRVRAGLPAGARS